MRIVCGDFVRPNNRVPGLPLGSVWRVVCTAGALKLEPENYMARDARHAAMGRRHAEHDFAKVALFRGQWVDVRGTNVLRDPYSFLDDVRPGRMSSSRLRRRTRPRHRPAL